MALQFNESANAEAAAATACRFCGTRLRHRFADLGLSPLCQTQIAPANLNEGEVFFPLVAYVCEACYLVQLGEYVPPETIFNVDYPYYSSYSDSWVDHARRYVEQITQTLELDADSFVVEIASNDGYLLQHFVARGIPCLGIEPADGVAQAARQRGVDTLVRFFGKDTAQHVVDVRRKAQLIVGNNVLAHVPDLNDFLEGMATLLASDGTITMEFPHLLRLIEESQFDTIYHEHFSYFSFSTVTRIFEHHGLTVYDVEEIPTHGGSLRIFAGHESGGFEQTARALELLERERHVGFDDLSYYGQFQAKVFEIRRELLSFLFSSKAEGKSVVGYGAPGKGNTLLNHCGIRPDLLAYTVDRNPNKAGTYTPGTRIPIRHPDAIFDTRPDYVLILPWNLRDEISSSMARVREWGCRFVVPIPSLEVF